jgi:hypothetical protein
MFVRVAAGAAACAAGCVVAVVCSLCFEHAAARTAKIDTVKNLFMARVPFSSVFVHGSLRAVGIRLKDVRGP